MGWFGTQIGWPVKIRDLNNRAAELIRAKQIDEAVRVLDEIERELGKRPRAVVDLDDLEPTSSSRSA